MMCRIQMVYYGRVLFLNSVVPMVMDGVNRENGQRLGERVLCGMAFGF